MKRGSGLEKYLDILNKNYRNLGIAAVFKVPTPGQIEGSKGGKTFGRKAPAVWVDYSGMLKGGRAVAVEAKYTGQPVVSFPLSTITDTQRDTLSLVHSMGGVAALYVRHFDIAGPRAISRDYFVPVSYLDALTRRSFRWSDVEQFRIPTGRTWVEAAQEWETYTEHGWQQLP